MRRFYITTISAVSLFFANISLCFAFALSPMSVSFEPSGRNATKSFLVENNSNEKVPVQMSMVGREMKIDGTENKPEADDDFIVYPPQFILGPNEKRTVRVTWAGDSEPKSELAYRIIAEQLPVDTEKKEAPKGAIIRMLLKYEGAVYITPKGAKAIVVVESATRVEPSQPKKPVQLAIVFENKGTLHQILKNLKMSVSSNGKKIELTSEDIKTITGQNILAKNKRKFLIAWPSQLPNGNVTVDIQFEG